MTTLNSDSTNESSTPVALLTRLTVAFARRRSYPDTHPLVLTAERDAFAALSESLQTRARWVLSVGDGVLFVDGDEVKRGAAVARELSERLRLRGVGAMTFDASATPESLRHAITWLALDPHRAEHRADANTPPVLPGITINRIAYGSLVLGDGTASESSTAEVWSALASMALLEETIGTNATAGHGESSSTDSRTPREVDTATPADVAGGIERRLAHDEYPQRVAFVLLRVAEQVAHAPPSHRDELAERLRSVLTALRSTSVASIIKSVGVGSEQRRFISQMIEALPASAIVEWLESAATATDAHMSNQMLRLLTKLSSQAQDGGRLSGGEHAFRSAARDVVRGWAPDAHASHVHFALLEQISAFDSARDGQSVSAVEAERQVHMALETNCVGDDAQAAIRILLTEGRVAELLAWADERPDALSTAQLRDALHMPDAVKEVLLHDTVDQSIARQFLSTLDRSAAETLIDVLRDAPNRTARRLVFDCLREFGSSLTPLYVLRLDGAPWYLVRNLLALLRDAAADDTSSSALPSDGVIVKFLDHPQEQVRLEAVRLLAADMRTHESAVARALDDTSDRVVRLALDALGTHVDSASTASLSPDVVRRLLRFLDAGHRDTELLARAVRALAGATPSAPLRERLIALVTKKTRVLKRLVLHDADPIVLASIEVLVRRYAADPAVEPIVERALKHEDRRMHEAVERARTTKGRAA